MLEMVNSYIVPSTLPEVVAFFIRSVIVDGIDIDQENEQIRKVVAGDILLTFIKWSFLYLKVSPFYLMESLN